MRDKIHKIIMEYMSGGKEMTPTDKMLLAINKRICALIDADCISRQDAIDIATQEGAYGYISAEELAEMPSAERKGKWVVKHDYR